MINTNELNRRGMRQTKNGGLQASDPESGRWIDLCKDEVEEIKLELQQFEDQIQEIQQPAQLDLRETIYQKPLSSRRCIVESLFKLIMPNWTSVTLPPVGDEKANGVA